METERMALEIPFSDPLGPLPVDPLVGLCKRWLGGIFEARERSVRNYDLALVQLGT